MNEFSFSLGKMRSGILLAVRTFMILVLIPGIIFLVLSTISWGGEAGPEWDSILSSWLLLLGVFAIPLVASSFLEGFYPLGSRSRLTFAILGNVLLASFIFSLFLGDQVQNALDIGGYDLNVMVFRYFVVGFAIIWGLISLGTYIDHRRGFVMEHGMALGLPAPPPLPTEVVADHRWYHDFRIRYGSWRTGLKTADNYYTRLMVLPIILFSVLGAVMVKANYDIANDLGESFLKEIAPLFWISLAMLPFGLIRGFFPKGSYSRMAGWLVLVALLCLWVWFLKLGGMVVLTLADLVEVQVNFQWIIILSMLAIALWGVYAILEVHYYRQAWVDNGYRPVNEKWMRWKWSLKKTRSDQA
jgi:hypothetical protein